MEMIPQEGKSRRTKKRKSIRLFGKDMVPEKRRSAIKKTRSSARALPRYRLPFALLQTAYGMWRRDFVYVTRKILEQSDVDERENRFLIPKNDVLGRVLSEEESRAVEGKEGLEIEVVDTRGGKYSMRLKEWPSLKKMVFNGGWRKLVEGNGLKAEVDCVELWVFRADSGRLCFGMNVKRENTINP